MLHRIVLYVGVVIVFLSMIVIGALPKLVPNMPGADLDLERW